MWPSPTHPEGRFVADWPWSLSLPDLLTYCCFPPQSFVLEKGFVAKNRCQELIRRQNLSLGSNSAGVRAVGGELPVSRCKQCTCCRLSVLLGKRCWGSCRRRWLVWAAGVSLYRDLPAFGVCEPLCWGTRSLSCHLPSSHPLLFIFPVHFHVCLHPSKFILFLVVPGSCLYARFLMSSPTSN